MSETLEAIKQLVSAGNVRISKHGYMAMMKLQMIPFIFVISSMKVKKLLLLKMIRNFRRIRLYLFFKLMVINVPSMWYGAFPKDIFTCRSSDCLPS
jgi:hypothetical protein